MRHPITVYLDSCDYSYLSDPNRRAKEAEEITRCLLGWSKSEGVRFVFSGIHVSEMAPLAAEYSASAISRADLLSDLCGKNALVSIDRLIAGELGRIVNGEEKNFQVLSPEGDWFPDIGGVVTPVQWVDAIRDTDAIGRESGLNRQQRRVLKRRLFRNGKPTRETLKLLLNGVDRSSEFLELYPMRPEDAKVIARYVAGTAAVDEANEAFLNSLRDVRWLARWFENHHDKLSPVYEWVRKPSSRIVESTNELATRFARARWLAEQSGDTSASRMAAEIWKENEGPTLVSVTNGLLEKLYPHACVHLTEGLISEKCPGLATGIRALYSSCWESMTVQPRTSRSSDLVDALHAMYAPYVDIFRADRYMAPHVQKCLRTHKTKIVSRLSELPLTIANYHGG